MKTVKYCNDGFEAQLIKGMLENEGIAASVINENIHNMLPFGSVIQNMSVQVMVADSDFDQATELVMQTHIGPTEVDTELCPECGSADIEYGYWGSKSLRIKIYTAFMLVLSALTGRPIGNIKNHYYCKKCRHEFNQ